MFASIAQKFTNLSVKTIAPINVNILAACIHSTPVVNANGPRNWVKFNKKFYPPQSENDVPRPAFVCHLKTNIHYSPKKMFYVASFIRGMTIDEALRQLDFSKKKGAPYIKETILEAQKMAVNDHNVEFKSNLWIAESFCSKGVIFKGIRRHAKMRVGHIEYKHSHYFVRLEEGKPPADYYGKDKTPEQQLETYVDNMRKRKITNSL